MSPSGPNIELSFNYKSILEGYRIVLKYQKEMEDGVEGAAERMSGAMKTYTEQVVQAANLAQRAQKRSLDALEKAQAMAGKTGLERIQAEHEAMLKKYKGEEEAIKRVNKIFLERIDREKKAMREAEEAAKKREAAEKAAAQTTATQRLFQAGAMFMPGGVGGMIGQAGQMAGMAGRLGAAGGEGGVMGVLGVAGISAATAAVAGLATGFVAMEAAGYAAAKSLGEYARDIHNVEIRTGMSAKEVQQFQFVAKVTGQDVGSLTQIMRGLTNAVEGTDQKAEKAREMLYKMKVDMQGLAEGTVKPLDLIKQIGAALEKEPNVWMQNKEAIDLFRRAGSVTLPMLLEMNKEFKTAEGINMMSDEKVKQFEKVNEQIAIIETQLKMVKLQLEGLVAEPFIITLKFVTGGNEPAKPGEAGPHAAAAAFGYALRPPPFMGPPTSERTVGPQKWMVGPTEEEKAKQHREDMAYQQQLDKTDIEVAEKHLKDLRDTYDKARASMRIEGAHKPEVAAAKKAMEDYKNNVVDPLKKAETDRNEAIRKNENSLKEYNAELAKTAEQVKDMMQHPFELPAEAQLRKFKEGLAKEVKTPTHPVAGGIDQAEFDRRVAGIKKELDPLIKFEREQETKKFSRLASEQQQQFERERMHLERTAIPPVEIRELGGKEGVTRVDVEQDILSAYKQRVGFAKEEYEWEKKKIEGRDIEAGDKDKLAQQDRDRLANEEAQRRNMRQAEITFLQDKRKLEEEDRKVEHEHRIAESKLDLETRVADIKHNADLAQRRAQMGFKGDNPAAGIREAYRINMQLSHDLYNEELKRIDQEEKGWQAQYDREVALRNLRREEAKEREDLELKLAEMVQRQMETIKQTVEPLVKTLFEHPTKFGGQLKTTLHEAAMKPIYSGLSEMTSRALHPLIYGATGTGGIAGMFGHLFGGGTKTIKDAKVDAEGALHVRVVASDVGTGAEAGAGGVAARLGLPTGMLYRLGIGSPPAAGGGGGGTMPQPTGTGGYGGGGRTGDGFTWPGWGSPDPWSLPLPNTWGGNPGYYGPTNPYVLSFAGGGGGGGGALLSRASGYPAAWTGASGEWTGPTLARPMGAAAPAEIAAPFFGTGAWMPGGGGAALASAMGFGVQGTAGGGRSRFGSLVGGLVGLFGGTGGIGAATKQAQGTSTVWSENPGTAGTDIDQGRVWADQTGGIKDVGVDTSGIPWTQKLGKMLNLKKADWFNAKVAGQAGGGIKGGIAGAATSPMAAQALLMGGTSLGMAGLAGERRGTWGGFGEAVGGGAMAGAGIGLMVGGPLGMAIGAGIGAAAGALASGLEMLFGVESPRHEAIRLVKSTYGININNSTADQIVSIAQQTYAGRVSMAVNSPQVRQMLGLYAAGSGQAGQFKAGSSMPYGGSLVESGGQLMQGATYQYGVAHTYSSNLPVYGGGSTVPLSAPGGGMGMQISMNIGGTDAAKFLTGNVITPEVVSSQMASAMYQSNGRTNQALMMNAPGAILA